MRLRRFHYRAGLVLLLPLALSAVTGLTYRVGRYWFGMSDDTGKFVRRLHEGAFLGDAVAPIYVLFVGLGLLAMIGAGLTLFRGPTLPHPAARSRRLHRWAAALFALPLAVSAATGIGFRLTQSWFGWSKSEAQWLLDIHQGTWLGPAGRAWYVLAIGTGLLFLLLTGFLQLIAGRRSRANGPNP